ncbi:MAG: glycosyltransferase family 2 protein [Candidatus Peribacteraceae bacterium]|nr:glycosyltransferase family 2 protein [Candidatus Peribacteraceae bacterium]
MHLSVIIPAYNEAERLPRTLDDIHRYFGSGESPFALQEVVVVDDGSADGTAAVVEAWKDRIPLQVIRFETNRGKGAATREGMLRASGEYHLLYDADGATPLEMLRPFGDAVRDHRPDVIIGSRIHELDSDLVKMSFYRHLMGRTYHALCSSLVPGIRDAACGFKLFTEAASRELFAVQRVDRFAFDIEVLSLALGRGMRVTEIPVHWRAVPGSKVRLVQDTLQMTGSVLGLYVRRFFRGRVRD